MTICSIYLVLMHSSHLNFEISKTGQSALLKSLKFPPVAVKSTCLGQYLSKPVRVRTRREYGISGPVTVYPVCGR